MAESTNPAAPAPRRREPRAATNEAPAPRAGELSAAAKAALAAASRDREAAPPRMGQRAQVDAIAALIEGGGESGERAPRRDRGRGNGADDEPAGDPPAARRRRGEVAEEERGTEEAATGDDAERRQEGADHDDGEHDDGEGEQHGDDDSVTLDDLARHAGLTAQELNKLPVRVGPDSMTFGELKAKLPDLAKLEQSRAEFEERRDLAELELI